MKAHPDLSHKLSKYIISRNTGAAQQKEVLPGNNRLLRLAAMRRPARKLRHERSQSYQQWQLEQHGL